MIDPSKPCERCKVRESEWQVCLVNDKGVRSFLCIKHARMELTHRENQKRYKAS